MGSDPKSWFLYPRTKGEVENELKEKKINLLSIFKPGLLRNRRDSRTI
jgi:oxidoreductase